MSASPEPAQTNRRRRNVTSLSVGGLRRFRAAIQIGIGDRRWGRGASFGTIPPSSTPSTAPWPPTRSPLPLHSVSRVSISFLLRVSTRWAAAGGERRGQAMHNRRQNGDSTKEEQQTVRNSEHEPLLTEKTNGHPRLEINDTSLSNSGMELYVSNPEEASRSLPVVESTLAQDLHPPESHTPSSGFPSVGENVEPYPNQQTMNYNELLRQYYELEEQRQKVAQQLQASYWNYQTPAQSTYYQSHQAPSVDASGHGLHPACSVSAPLFSACGMGGGVPSGGGCCYCSAWTTCCPASHVEQCPGGLQCQSQTGTCPIANSCMTVKQCTPEDDSVARMGMLAAERAISSMQKELSSIKTSSGSGVEKVEVAVKEDGSGIFGGDGSQSVNSDTNLSTLLGAWYAAGFHTGRYVMEQSKRNRSK